VKTKLIAADRMIVGQYAARSADTLNHIRPGPKHDSCAKRLKHGVRFVLIRLAAAYVSLWPLRFASAVGARFGVLAWSIFCGERKKALDSLAVAFPERAEAERRAVGRASFAHLGRVVCELACLPELDRSIDTFIDWPAESRAVLDAALARKKGVIFVSGHVGHWELLARGVALAGYPVQVIAREAGDPRMTAIIESMRTAGGVKSIWRGRPGAAKDMLRAIERGEILGLLIDQDMRVPSVFVPFFGREARTPRAAADLALCTGAAVVLGFCQRVGPTSFRLSMREMPVPAVRGESAVVELTRALTQGIEAAIRSNPEQWVWMHRRWRSRPEEQGSLANPQNKIMKANLIPAALAALTLTSACAQTTTLSSVKTRIGTLKFEKGFPTEEAARKLF